MNKNSLFRQIKGDIEAMSDKEFLATRGFYDLIRSQIYGVLRKGESVSIELVSEDSDVTAYTTGDVIHCNTWSPLVLPCENRYAKYLSNIGSASHECGHVLYTDFETLNLIRRCIVDGSYDFKYRNELSKRHPALQQKFRSSMCDMINIVEDMYIENCLMKEYPAQGILVQGLHVGNKVKYDHCPTMNHFIALIETGQILFLDAFLSLLQVVSCLGYEPKEANRCSGKIYDDLMASLEDIKPLVEKYRDSEFSHRSVIKEIVTKCYEMLPSDEDLFDENPDMGSSGSGQKNNSSTKNEDNKASPSSNNSGNSESRNSNNDEQSENSPQDGSSNDEKSQTGAKTDTSNEKKAKSSKLSDSEKRELISRLNKAAEEAKKDTQQSSEATGQGNAKRSMVVKEREGNQKPKSVVDQSENLNKQVAQNEANRQNNRMNNEQVEDTIQETMHGYFPRSGFSVNCIRNTSVSTERKGRERYLSVYDEVKPYSKSCQRMIKQILNKKEDEEFDSGHIMGNRFNVGDYFRKDGKYFSREVTPGDNPDIVFSVLVDASGSMSGSKIIAARKAAILIDDMCRGLNIPCSISTHTTRGWSWDRDVLLETYTYFDSPEKDKYFLGNIEAYNSNVDTIALSIKAHELEKRPEKTKVLLVISDGLPCCTVTSGNSFKGVPFKELNDSLRDDEMRELNACVRYWRNKKDIKILGFAVDEAEQVKAIYETGCIDCSKLEMLPKELVRVFKRYVLTTKK